MSEKCMGVCVGGGGGGGGELCVILSGDLLCAC